jgi:type IX secretion system PorP/SprF family membrane protein
VIFSFAIFILFFDKYTTFYIPLRKSFQRCVNLISLNSTYLGIQLKKLNMFKINSKRFNLKKTIVSILLFAIYNHSIAQDIQFSQFYAVPLYQNPAFVGSVHALRGIAHTRLQWLGLDATYKTYYLSADTYLDKYRSGLGVQFIRDIQGNNTISSNELSFMYSYELPISSSFTVRAGLQGTAVQRSLDYSNLTFPGQHNDQNGFIGGGNYNTGVQNKWYPDISSGIVAYSDRFWGGFSMHHMNMPNQSFPGGGDASLPINTVFLWLNVIIWRIQKIKQVSV